MKKVALILTLAATLIIFWGAAPKKAVDSKLKEEMYYDAIYFFESEDWKEALFSFLKLNDVKPNNGNISFHIGMCYLNIPGEEAKAIPYLELATKKISPEWENTFEETKAPLHALFYLGNAYRINNQISEALKVYDKFQNHPFFENHYNAGMVEREISACERAKTIRDKPIHIIITPLDSTINNAQANYRPVVSSDEKTIIYMNAMKFYNAIFMSRFVDGAWTEPDDISPQVGSDGDTEPACLSADGNELYLIRKVKKQKDIYLSTWDGKRWTNMVALNKNINSSKDETSAFLSANGQTLYFSSKRNGGEGELDMYRSEKDKSGNWGSASNLGKRVNTPFNENNPMVSENDSILFFESEGNLNMGGYDIFTSRRLSGKNWESPVNIGYPINTTSDNPYFFPLKNGKIAYMSLNLPEGHGKEDIYRIEILPNAKDSIK